MSSKRIGVMSVAACAMFPAGTFAAVCTASSGTIVSVGTIVGDLCGATDQLVQTCGDTTTIGNARDSIYQIQLGVTNLHTFVVTGTGFAPYVALMNGDLQFAQ